MWARIGDKSTPWELAHDDARYPLARYLAAADAVGRDDAAPRQREWIADPDDAIRYWATVGLHARPQLDAADRNALRDALTDASPVVRIEAAAALAATDETALPVLTAALRDDPPEVALHAARALELLGPAARPVHSEMEDRLATAREAEARGEVIAMFIRFSLETALTR